MRNTPEWTQARAHRLVINNDRARPAFTVPTTEFGAFETQLPQHFAQWRVKGRVSFVVAPVDCQ